MRSRPTVLFVLLLFPAQWSCAMGQTVPDVRAWIAERHLVERDFMQRGVSPLDGPIVVGQRYTLVLEMTMEHWDFLVESCTCSSCRQQNIFLEQGGCLRRDAHWLEKQEFWLSRRKIIMVHFFAPESILRIQCQTRVVQCCGCCNNFCERLQPALDQFQSYQMPVSCNYPIGLAPEVPQILPGCGADCGTQLAVPVVPVEPVGVPSCWLPLWTGCSATRYHWFWPWLVGLVVLLLLLCLLCLLALCILFGCGSWRLRDRIWPSQKVPTPLPLPPPPAEQVPRIFLVDRSSQTNGAPAGTATIQHTPPVPIPLPDYEQQRHEQAAGFERVEGHAAVPLCDWEPINPWGWTRTREECITEEREWTETEARPVEHLAENGRRSGVGQVDGYGRDGHYVNWSREAHSNEGRHWQEADRRNGWTRFGTEPPVQQEEEDRFQWKTTSPDGALQREVDQRSRWQRSVL